MNVWKQIIKIKNEIRQLKKEQVDRHNATGDLIETFISEISNLTSKVLQLQIDIADLKTENTRLKQKVYSSNELFVMDVSEKIRQMELKAKQDEIEYKKPVKDISDHMKTLDEQLQDSIEYLENQ